MPPQRRASRAHPAATPYAEAGRCLSRCHRRRKRVNLDVGGGGEDGAHVGILPDDALSVIFSRVPSGDAGVARCAATCRRWGRVVATRAAAIAHALPTPWGAGFLPHLALGLLHEPEGGGRALSR
ncbi:hypothetical protein C2845_PM13G25230 [Panicum miliaceum]|uniref:F-box domain-containing protein n=1 Tax=Panicum miliaceum TaxID=4540 RepID=A0A3L6RMG2_PANMI|nr:hypothetical protein C2845_PM13G25230 [Panicum miliaceum]